MSVVEITEELFKIRMFDRLARIISDQILLGNISHVVALVILGQQMIERLILGRTAVFRNGHVPFLGIRKDRVDIENHTPEWVFAMTDNLAQGVFCTRLEHVFLTPDTLS